MRLLSGEVLKLARRPATYICLLITVLLTALIYVSLGATYKMPTEQLGGQNASLRTSIEQLLTFPEAYKGLVSFLVGLGGLLAVAFGAAVAGADWNWSMVKMAISRGESRSRYTVMKLVAIVVVLIPGLIAAFLIGILCALLGAVLAGLPLSGLTDGSVLGDLASLLVRGWWGLAEQAALGFAVATVARSQLAGLGAAIALYFVESFAVGFWPEVIRYFPFSVSASLVRDATTAESAFSGAASSRIDTPTAFLLVTGYLIVAAAVSAVFLERSEITG